MIDHLIFSFKIQACSNLEQLDHDGVVHSLVLHPRAVGCLVVGHSIVLLLRKFWASSHLNGREQLEKI